MSHQKRLTNFDGFLTPAAKRDRADATLLAPQSWSRTIAGFWPVAVIVAGVVWLILR